MKTTEYLYGKDFDSNILKLQKEVAIYKIKRAKLLITELQKVQLMKRDDERISSILEAIDFNKNLLNEH